MAKLTYLQITNRILKRIGYSTIGDVTSASGTEAIITELINEAQLELFNEQDWYSLYKTRTFTTTASTAEYSLNSDFGRGIVMINETSNIVMKEDYTRIMDINDPDSDLTGIPRTFAIQGSNYRLFPIPDGVYTIRERYFKLPVDLTLSADTSDLPIECQNSIIYYVLWRIKEFLKEFNEADRNRLLYKDALKKAIYQNNKKINKMIVLEPVSDAGMPLVTTAPYYGLKVT